MTTIVIKKDGPAKPRKRGSKPGVKRGSYKPRRIKALEPQTPDEVALRNRICREYWGAEACDSSVMCLNRRTGLYQPVRTLLPKDHEHQPEPAPGSRVCRGCGAELDMSEFTPNGHGGHKARCKSCLAETAREYASKPEGKAARARAQAKYRASVKADERRKKDQTAFIAAVSRTPKGREFLVAIGVATETNQERSE